MLEFYLSIDVADTTRPFLPREQDDCKEFWSRMIYRKEKDNGCLYEALIMGVISGGGYLDILQVKPLTVLRRL